MPELPEVETVRRELSESILGKKMKSISIQDSSVIRGSDASFQKAVIHQSFHNITRIGKLLQFHLGNDHIMLAHLKMTGQFLYQEAGQIEAGIFPLLYASTPGGKKTVGRFREEQREQVLPDKHTHITFHFTDGSQLSFRDQRKFGYLEIIPKASLSAIESKYGIDPLRDHFTLENFLEQCEGRKKSLKAVLMDQHIIAGIGNIYADEICHQINIRPQRSIARLSKKKKEEIFYSISDIIQSAVQNKGTTFRDFARSNGEKGNNAHELQVYGRAGFSCNTCTEGTIKKVQYLGRGTHYCPHCQR